MSTPEPVPTDHLQSAYRYLKAGDFPQAANYFRQVIQANEFSIDGHEGLGAIAFEQRDFAKAIEHFRFVTRIDPKRVSALINLGAAYHQKGDYQNAVKTLRLALVRDRNSAQAYFNLGIAEKHLRHFPLALCAFTQAIRIAPQMVEAHIMQGQTYIDLLQPKQAISHFETALKIRPESRRAREGLQLAQSQIGEAKSAASPFGRLVDEQTLVTKANSYQPVVSALTANQRHEDRQAIVKLAAQAVIDANELLQLLRNELEPNLHSLSRITLEGDRRSWGIPFQTFQGLKQKLRDLSEAAGKSFQAIGNHEQEVRNLQKHS
ncbi:tetratricopeptide repeat protein [Planctomicrobium sp. SH668]|uniref:tetratricopeptide repeat protein n=1 Tax=Planctomicrobium sp. SH668 TaxID=3448126 RepID=UPI003F5C03A3